MGAVSNLDVNVDATLLAEESGTPRVVTVGPGGDLDGDAVREIRDRLEPAMVTVAYDAKTFVYSAGVLTAVQFRLGGVAGTVVKTKTFAYDLDGVLTGISVA